ncbi:MAG: bifunctional nuclease family protein [Dissulfuribacterales bacterium]
MHRIPVYVQSITLDPDSNSPVLLLQELNGSRTLPIWIGVMEATAIASELERLQFTRPMTHDLLVTFTQKMGIEILEVEISEMENDTFYAVITARNGELVSTIDARPSDAVAIALKTKAPIYVNDRVMQKVKMETASSHPSQPQNWDNVLEELGPEHFKYKM